MKYTTEANLRAELQHYVHQKTKNGELILGVESSPIGNSISMGYGIKHTLGKFFGGGYNQVSAKMENDSNPGMDWDVIVFYQKGFNNDGMVWGWGYFSKLFPEVYTQLVANISN